MSYSNNGGNLSVAKNRLTYRGYYYDKDPNVRNSWHPDLDHPNGVDPHWDFNDIFKHKWRVFKDGSLVFLH